MEQLPTQPIIITNLVLLRQRQRQSKNNHIETSHTGNINNKLIQLQNTLSVYIY
jgi:hypothetical protein